MWFLFFQPVSTGFPRCAAISHAIDGVNDSDAKPTGRFNVLFPPHLTVAAKAICKDVKTPFRQTRLFDRAINRRGKLPPKAESLLKQAGNPTMKLFFYS